LVKIEYVKDRCCGGKWRIDPLKTEELEKKGREPLAYTKILGRAGSNDEPIATSSICLHIIMYKVLKLKLNMWQF